MLPSEIANIERATITAVSPYALQELPGWLLPFNSGTVGRAISDVPLKQHLTPLGYRRQQPTLVQTGSALAMRTVLSRRGEGLAKQVLASLALCVLAKAHNENRPNQSLSEAAADLFLLTPGDPFMYYIVESSKSFNQASTDLEASVLRNGFGVLHVHDLGATLRSKGISFAEDCKVFEVCNPAQAAKVLSTDMRLNMALPCRISVYTEHGKTKLGMITPVKMLSTLSQDASIAQIAQEVEEKTMLMVDEAK